jgi:hypothetical protein
MRPLSGGENLDVYPPPGVSPAVVAEVERFEALAGVVLATGFGGLVGGFALSLAVADRPAGRALILAAAVASGLAAMLACYGLTCSFATDPPDDVFERKWLGGHRRLVLASGGLAQRMRRRFPRIAA